MSFFASNFVFDNISSETFNLKIGYLDGGQQTSSSGSDVTLITDKVRRNPELYYYGSEITPVLTFDMVIFSQDPLDVYDRNAINKWLFGRQGGYKTLRIEQSDMEFVSYQCLLSKPEDIYMGNLAYCKKFTVNCKMPWGLTDEIPYDYTIVNTSTITFNNLSANDDYLYPILTFTLDNSATSFSINNVTDNRLFSFTGLTGGETITVDNQRQIITSSLGLNRLSKFNYNFLRLLPDFNTLVITGSCTMTLKMKFPVKVGG